MSIDVDHVLVVYNNERYIAAHLSSPIQLITIDFIKFFAVLFHIIPLACCTLDTFLLLCESNITTGIMQIRLIAIKVVIESIN